MSVRAKFKVIAIERTETSMPAKKEDGSTEYRPVEMRSIRMTPVYTNGDPEHENTKFWQASPSGELRLGCVNLAAAEQFELGGEYYLDFTPAT